MPNHGIGHRKDARRRGTLVRLVLGLMMLVSATALATYQVVGMMSGTAKGTIEADEHSRAVSEHQPSEDMLREMERAREYNRKLAGSGQPVIGEMAADGTGTLSDPFATSGAPVKSVSDADADYQSQLSIPADGIMATVSYPRLGISLPIRHGTSLPTLAAGAGHLYGTSLPVGGESTHSVISAHTGLADRLMFDRLSLGEGRIGDAIYVEVLGETLAYKVTGIRTVTPDDVSSLRIERGRDLLTLVTCTPYGVNTHRLLVTAERASIPDEVPAREDTPSDASGSVATVAIGALWALVIAYSARRIVMERKHGTEGDRQGSTWEEDAR